MQRINLLVINPGSTSTKVAVFIKNDCLAQKSLRHSAEELAQFEQVTAQFEYREQMIINWLKEEKIEMESLAAVVGRGGLLRPMPGGTYIVTDAMVKDLKVGIQGEHASNLGGILAKGIADTQGIHSYIVDPVAVDEYHDIARISGQL